MFGIVNEPSDKHRFSTACRSGNHTGKQMYPWHKMIGIVSVWNPKQKRIIGFQNIIGFAFIVSIAAAAATAAPIPLSAEAVYFPFSAAAAAYSPRSAALRLFSRDTTVRTRT